MGCYGVFVDFYFAWSFVVDLSPAGLSTFSLKGAPEFLDIRKNDDEALSTRTIVELLEPP